MDEAGWRLNELSGGGWSWVELGGAGWSWVELDAQFSNTLLKIGTDDISRMLILVSPLVL